MRVLKSLCRFKMCADVKDSLVMKSPFPVLTRDWNKFLFFFPRPPEVVNFPLKSLLETTFAQSKQIWSFDDGNTHRLIDLVGVESAHAAIEGKDSQMKPENPNESHATHHFWREMQMETYQGRLVYISRLRRSRSAASTSLRHRAECLLFSGHLLPVQQSL